VSIEHAFGVLKGRWVFLRSARMRMETEEDKALAHGMIQAAFVLHNLLLTTWSMFVTQEKVDKIIREERIMKERTITVDGDYEELAVNHRRREFLVDECIEHLQESEDDIQELLYK
jgi:hypothetical protein